MKGVRCPESRGVDHDSLHRGRTGTVQLFCRGDNAIISCHLPETIFLIPGRISSAQTPRGRSSRHSTLFSCFVHAALISPKGVGIVTETYVSSGGKYGQKCIFLQPASICVMPPRISGRWDTKWALQACEKDKPPAPRGSKTSQVVPSEIILLQFLRI